MTDKEFALLTEGGFITRLLFCSPSFDGNIHRKIWDANNRLCAFTSLYSHVQMADRPYSDDFISVCVAICQGVNDGTSRLVIGDVDPVCEHCWVGRTSQEIQEGINADKEYCAWCGIKPTTDANCQHVFISRYGGVSPDPERCPYCQRKWSECACFEQRDEVCQLCGLRKENTEVTDG